MASPTLYQLRHDPPGEPEALIVEDEGMDIEREEATGGHYKYEVCRRSTWGKQPKSSALLWCVFTQKLPHPVVFGLPTVGNELAHHKQLCLNSVSLRITRLMLMVCFLSLHPGPGREAPGMACPSGGSQG